MNSLDKSATTDKSDPLAGKVINNFKLIERLGQGGMGLVYRAEQLSIKREVAVKMLPFRLINDELNIKRIEREATAMGNLRHPNIATIFDFGFSEEGQAYLVMELIRGQTLRDLIHNMGALPAPRAATIMAQVAEAMEYAHQHGIIHRDLKPDNIMLDCEHKEDFVKILDFGIAKNTAGDSISLTQAGTVVGSPLYMSPEQCMGLMLSNKTDIYSLGVIMYEALTGEAPCKGASSYETIRKKTTEAPPAFPETLSDIKELEELTMKCLALRQGDRPETMGAIKQALMKTAGMSTTDVILPTVNHTPDSIKKTISGTGPALHKNHTPSGSRPPSNKDTKFWQDMTEESRISGETLTGREITAEDPESGVHSAAGAVPATPPVLPQAPPALPGSGEVSVTQRVAPPALPGASKLNFTNLIRERKVWYAIASCALIMISIAILMFVMMSSQSDSTATQSANSKPSEVKGMQRMDAITADDLMGQDHNHPMVSAPVALPPAKVAPAPSTKRATTQMRSTTTARSQTPNYTKPKTYANPRDYAPAPEPAYAPQRTYTPPPEPVYNKFENDNSYDRTPPGWAKHANKHANKHKNKKEKFEEKSKKFGGSVKGSVKRFWKQLRSEF